MPRSACNQPGGAWDQHELDRAFLSWLEAKAASDGDAIDYLVALALQGSGWAHGGCAH